jgi:hypothetical protein
MSEGSRLAASLRAAVEEGRALFEGAGEARTAQRPPSGGWCAREVIGHLIDSACNNHRRFIINQDAPVLVIDDYDQNAWVERNRWANTAAADLVALWSAYNRQLARVFEAIPDEVLNRPRGPIAGYRFGYIAPPASADATLGYVADDYVGHIRHHLKQIHTLLAR